MPQKGGPPNRALADVPCWCLHLNPSWGPCLSLPARLQSSPLNNIDNTHDIALGLIAIQSDDGILGTCQSLAAGCLTGLPMVSSPWDMILCLWHLHFACCYAFEPGAVPAECTPSRVW